ncbi:MAG: addiction module protein [Ottowia sp.]|uniref:addiction module protein n=1 Tax=Ottowia sp. TaxID=1898956 RepID=UPI0039E65733
MSATVEELATQANALSAADRARLVGLLLASLPDDEDAEAAWEQEIRQRVEAIESGHARLVPASDVHAQARKLYRQ